MAEKARFFEGRKFMWDGEEYDNEEKASAAEKLYREKGFEAAIVREGSKTLLYTRRVVTEVVVQ